MTSDSRPLVAYGLLAGALGIALLMGVWLMSSGAEAGGIVLGLLLLFLLAGPLAGAGVLMLARGRTERAEEQAFADQRRVLEADSLFRRELSARLTELSRRVPAQFASTLQSIADGVQRGRPDESAWYGAITLDTAHVADLKQYEDLAWEHVRWLLNHTDANEATITEALDELRSALDRRADVLLRARRAPTVAPSTLLRASGTVAQQGVFTELGLGDALTHDGTDYVVDRVASSFSDGQTWTLAHLSPSGGEERDAWLSISPGALELAWLHSMAAPTLDAPVLTVENSPLPLQPGGSMTALVTVSASAGSAPGVLVRTWRYRADDRVAQVEQWPNGVIAAYAGKIIRPRELEIWPAASVTPEVART